MADRLVLDGCHALILRPVDRAQPLVDLIVGAGGRATTAPLITREPISGGQRAELDAHTANLAGFAWVAVTSVNAVAEVVDSIIRTHSQRRVAEVARGTRWASVGRATTRALAEHGIEVAFEAKENSAAGMLTEWPAMQPPAGSSADAESLARRLQVRLLYLRPSQRVSWTSADEHHLTAQSKRLAHHHG